MSTLIDSNESIDILLIESGINYSLLGLSDHPPVRALFDIRKKWKIGSDLS